MYVGKRGWEMALIGRKIFGDIVRGMCLGSLELVL